MEQTHGLSADEDLACSISYEEIGVCVIKMDMCNHPVILIVHRIAIDCHAVYTQISVAIVDGFSVCGTGWTNAIRCQLSNFLLHWRI